MSHFDTKSIYLKKDGQIIGLHAIGYNDDYKFDLYDKDGTVQRIKTDFNEYEKWGNYYNDSYEMIGRGSFRVFAPTLEHAAKELLDDGWIRFERIEDGSKS